MSNSSGKKLKSVMQSRRLVMPIVAILSANFQIGTRAVSTANACSSLGAFVHEVQAQSDKKIAAAQADQLINSANQIEQELGCQ